MTARGLVSCLCVTEGRPAFIPWLLRARSLLEVDLAPWEHVAEWVERLGDRPAVRAESELVASL